MVVVDGNRVEEFDFEAESKRQLAGNIYLAKVTRVEPSLQAAFVDYGGNRHGFLAFAEIHPDYYQIPVADREALLAEEMAVEQEGDEDDQPAPAKPRRRRRAKAEATRSDDAVATGEAAEDVRQPDAEDARRADDSADGADASASEGAEREAEARTAAVVAEIPGMDIVDLQEGDEDGNSEEREKGDESQNGDKPSTYRAMDDASTRDSEIEFGGRRGRLGRDPAPA